VVADPTAAEPGAEGGADPALGPEAPSVFALLSSAIVKPRVLPAGAAEKPGPVAPKTTGCASHATLMNIRDQTESPIIGRGTAMILMILEFQGPSQPKNDRVDKIGAHISAPQLAY